MYLFIITLYKSSITDIEHSTNYTASDLPQTHQVRQWQPYIVVIYIYKERKHLGILKNNNLIAYE